MTATRGKAWLAIASIFLLEVSPALAAVRPHAPSEPSVGIIRTGEILDPSHEKAYPLVEKGLRRWFAERPSLDMKVLPIDSTLSVASVTLRAREAELSRASESLVKAVSSKATGPTLEALFLRMKEVRDIVETVLGNGPMLQKAYLAEAIYWWSKKDPLKAKASVETAVRLHPDREVPGLHSWDWPLKMGLAEAFENRLDREIAAVAKTLPRSCSLSLSVSPKGAEVTVNGFNVGMQRAFQLSAGTFFEVKAVKPGFEPYRRYIECNRHQQHRFIVSLKKDRSGGFSTASLDYLAAKHGVSSLLLVKSEQERFQFFLYQPQIGMSEVPLRKPVRVAEVLSAPLESEIPIATDAFMPILESGKETAFFLPGEPMDGSLAMDLEEDSEWYNDWKVWTVAGGILTTVILLAATNRDNSVSTGIRINLD